MFKFSIFQKIYLCFWMTVLLAMTIQVTLNNRENWRPLARLKQYVLTSHVSSLEMFGQAAAVYYRAGDPQAVARLADRLKQGTDIDALVLDEAGNRLDGGAVTPLIRSAVSQALQSGKAERVNVAGRHFLAVPVSAPTGKRLVVVGSFDHERLILALGTRRLAARITVWLLISGLVCYLLTRYLVSPLLALRDATRRFAAGDLSVRIGARIDRRGDEITELAHDFDVMAERIESLIKLQRQLVGDISHELRSPLARLNVALDLARQQTGVEAAHALDRIEEEAQELNEMIGELLTLTRLENGSSSVEMEPVELTALLGEIAEDGDFEAQGSNRGVKLLESEPCTISGNRELLRRAVENVVRNAICHTSENTDVEIRMKKKAGQVRIQVRDHGPGLPEDELDNIFLPFYRASQSRERQTGGTGLGLAISQRAVQLHHGTVTAENAPGGGLLVTFLF